MSPLQNKGPVFHFLNPLSNSVQEGERDGLFSKYDVNEDESVSCEAKGRGLLDEDFLSESTPLGIPENNAEVVAPPCVNHLEPCASMWSGGGGGGGQSASKDDSPASIRSLGRVSLGSWGGVSANLQSSDSIHVFVHL